MALHRKLAHAVRTRMIKRWGSLAARQRLWDQEFAKGQWDYLADTMGDPVYACLERYAKRGSILDLGCGSGNTGSELDSAAYDSYTGVDLSEVALRTAERRAQNDGRGTKNVYVRADIETYVPERVYDVILFRESIFYVPVHKVGAVLDRYSPYLRGDGVFIVRVCDRSRHRAIIRLIEARYRVVHRHVVEHSSDIVLVFAPEAGKGAGQI